MSRIRCHKNEIYVMQSINKICLLRLSITQFILLLQFNPTKEIFQRIEKVRFEAKSLTQSLRFTTDHRKPLFRFYTIIIALPPIHLSF